MGVYKEINDSILARLLERLAEEGYEDIEKNPTVFNKIVDLIDAIYDDPEMFEELVSAAIKIIKQHKK